MQRFLRQGVPFILAGLAVWTVVEVIAPGYGWLGLAGLFAGAVSVFDPV